MEFTVRLTEQDYIEAYKLKRRSKFRLITRIFVFAMFALFWTTIGAAFWIEHRPSHDPSRVEAAVAMRESLQPGAWFLSAFLLLYVFGIPWLLKRQYRKNDNLKAEFFNEVTAEGITQKSSKGSSSHTLWNAFRSWRESDRVMIIEFPSGLYLVLPKSEMSPDQQTELRGIVAAALPKR
jgi:hypothetical protein